MASNNSTNVEVAKLEQFLDTTAAPFEGSDFWNELHDIYTDLDQTINLLKMTIDEINKKGSYNHG